MMIRTRGRRLVSRLEALERVYDTRGPRVFRVIFEYGGEPTIVTIFRDENRTEIIEPPPPDDDPDEFYGAFDSTETLDVSPAPQPDDETPSSFPVGARHAVPTTQPAVETTRAPSEPRASASGPVIPCHTVGTYVTRRPRKLAKLSRSRQPAGPAAENRAERCPSGRGPRGLTPAALCGYVQQADCRARFRDLGSLLDQWASTASNCCFAAATTLSAVKPNFFWSSLSGAEAPNVLIPML